MRRQRYRTRPFDHLESRSNPSALAEPVVLSSLGGVLDITLTAHRSSQVIEVAGADRMAAGTPTLVDGFMTYAWTLHRGLASDGRGTGDTYPAPTLKVQPGDTLRIRLENQLGDQPTNIHTHGLEIAPTGNADNVLLDLPPGAANQYEFAVPRDHRPGALWYHPHRHQHTEEQVYRGLAGFLIVGQADSEVDQVRGLPTRLLAMQVQRIEANAATGRPELVPLRNTFANTQYTINGQYLPDLQMTSPYEVWVTLDADPHNLARTFLPSNDNVAAWDFDSPDNQTVDYIAQDGSAFPRTVPKYRAALAPGKRVAEVVAAPAAGEERLFALTALLPVTPQSGNPNDFPSMNQPLMRVRGVGAGGDPQVWTNRPLTGPGAASPDLSLATVDEHRTLVFETDRSTNTFRFLINGQTFPDAPVFQPRAGSVEEWTVVNRDPFPHPLHIHLQPFQAQYRAGLYETLPDGTRIEYDNRPPHTYDQDVFYIEPYSAAVVRIRWANTLGETVVHCHNLAHEDKGMMALIHVIPNAPLIAAAPALGGGTVEFSTAAAALSPAAQPAATVTPFGPTYRGGLSVAMGDFNGDGIPDAAFGGRAPGGRVVVRNGAANFAATLRDFRPFRSTRPMRVNVAAGDVNGDLVADVIVAAARGSAPAVRVFSGRTGALIAEFLAFDPAFRGGVNLAAADVDGSGRVRIITAPASGHAPMVRVWGWDLFNPAPGTTASTPLGGPKLVTEFLAGAARDRRGLDLATTYYAADAGGFARIVTAPTRDADAASVWMLRTPAMDHAAGGMHAMDSGLTATRLATVRPGGPRRVAPAGFAIGSINAPRGSLLAISARGDRPAPVQLFAADPDNHQPIAAGVLKYRGRGRGLALAGS